MCPQGDRHDPTGTRDLRAREGRVVIPDLHYPNIPDVEAVCHDYAQRWFGSDWPLMDEDEKAELRIEAHRWLKCIAALGTTGAAEDVIRKALEAVVKFIGNQEPDKLPDDLLYGMLGIETMCR